MTPPPKFTVDDLLEIETPSVPTATALPKLTVDDALAIEAEPSLPSRAGRAAVDLASALAGQVAREGVVPTVAGAVNRVLFGPSSIPASSNGLPTPVPPGDPAAPPARPPAGAGAPAASGFMFRPQPTEVAAPPPQARPPAAVTPMLTPEAVRAIETGTVPATPLPTRPIDPILRGAGLVRTPGGALVPDTRAQMTQAVRETAGPTISAATTQPRPDEPATFDTGPLPPGESFVENPERTHWRDGTPMTSGQRAYIKALRANRAVANVAGGLANVVAGTLQMVPWGEALVGIETPLGTVSRAGAKRIESVVEQISPQDPNLLDQIASGFGSTLGFFIPGKAAELGVRSIHAAAPRLARWVGASAMAVTEAGTEAGMLFNELVRSGVDPAEAARRANWTFGMNMVLLTATNKAGVFAERGGMVRRGAKGTVSEAAQEGSQGVIQDVFSEASVTETAGRAPGSRLVTPAKLRQRAEEAVVGGVVGGTFGGAVGVAEDLGKRQAIEGLQGVRGRRAAERVAPDAGAVDPGTLRDAIREEFKRLLEAEEPAAPATPAPTVPGVAEPAAVPAGDTKPAPVSFAGWQQTRRGPVALWHLTAEIPGHPVGSTLMQGTLEREGYAVPEAPESPSPVSERLPSVAEPATPPVSEQSDTVLENEPDTTPAAPPVTPRADEGPVETTEAYAADVAPRAVEADRPIVEESRQPAAPAPAPTAAPGAFTLPRALAGAKPRFGYGSKNYELDFASDLDRALFIVAQSTPSKRDADYMQALRSAYPGTDDAALRQRGRDVRARLKVLLQGQSTDAPVRIEPITKPPSTAKPAAPTVTAPVTPPGRAPVPAPTRADRRPQPKVLDEVPGETPQQRHDRLSHELMRTPDISGLARGSRAERLVQAEVDRLRREVDSAVPAPKSPASLGSEPAATLPAGDIHAEDIPVVDTPAAPSGYGASNTLVTAARAEELRRRLREKLGRVTMGLDPTLIPDLAELGLFHFEAGTRQAAAWTAKMVDDLGEKARPFLANLFGMVQTQYELATVAPAPDTATETVPEPQRAAPRPVASDTAPTLREGQRRGALVPPSGEESQRLVGEVDRFLKGDTLSTLPDDIAEAADDGRTLDLETIDDNAPVRAEAERLRDLVEQHLDGQDDPALVDDLRAQRNSLGAIISALTPGEAKVSRPGPLTQPPSARPAAEPAPKKPTTAKPGRESNAPTPAPVAADPKVVDTAKTFLTLAPDVEETVYARGKPRPDAVEIVDRWIERGARYRAGLPAGHELVGKIDAAIADLRRVRSEVTGEPVAEAAPVAASEPVADDEALPGAAPTGPRYEHADRLRRLFEVFDDRLQRGQLPRDPRELRKLAAETLGVDERVLTGDSAVLDDLYDAIEAATNSVYRDGLPPTDASVSAQIETARAAEEALGNRTRTLEIKTRQQFSTPLPIAAAGVYALDLKPDETVGEPTGGTGNLVAPLPLGTPVVINEIDSRRAETLRLQRYAPTEADYLVGGFGASRPDVIHMNPPWGRYSTRRYGQPIPQPYGVPVDVAERFVVRALRDVKAGGRIVAIMPTTVLESPRFLRWLEREHTLRALVQNPAGSYDTRGTSVDSVILVVDQGRIPDAPTPIRGTATDWADLAGFLEPLARGGTHARGRQPRVESGRSESPAPPRPAESDAVGGRPDDGGVAPGVPGRSGRPAARPGTGDARPGVVASGEPGGATAPAAPARPELPVEPATGGGVVGDERVRLGEPPEGQRFSYASRDEFEAALGSPIFAPVPLRAAPGQHPHPRLVVATRSLAGAPLPPLTYRLQGQIVADAYARGAISDQQLDYGVLPALQSNARRRGYLVAADVGVGKALPLDAPVLTPRGWRVMGELHVGDDVIGADGQPTTILGVYPQGERMIYRVTFSDGAAVECDDEHLWFTTTTYERNNERRHPRGHSGQVRPLSEIRASLHAPTRAEKNHRIPVVAPVKFASQPVTLDPYVLGVLLGDGCLRRQGVSFTTADEAIARRVAESLPVDVVVRHRPPYQYSITDARGRCGRARNPVLDVLRAEGLAGKRSYEKHVPNRYLFNDATVRLGVLRGLMDTDGYVDARGSTAVFTTTSPQLAADVVFLTRSLGGIAIIREKRGAGYRHKGERRRGRVAFNVSVTLPDPLNPFSLHRKAARIRPKSKYPPRRYIVAVDPVGMKPAQCIAVSAPDGLFAIDGFVVTHNSRVAAAIISEWLETGQASRVVLLAPNEINEAALLREFAEFAGGEFPFPIIRLRGMTESKDRPGQERQPLPKHARAVYLVDRYNFAAYATSLSEVEPDAVVADEAHLLKNIEGAKVGVAWLAFQNALLARRGKFVYMTATPAVEFEDLKQMVGFREWTADTWDDYVRRVTGSGRPQTVDDLHKEWRRLRGLLESTPGIPDDVRAKTTTESDYQPTPDETEAIGRLTEAINTIRDVLLEHTNALDPTAPRPGTAGATPAARRAGRPDIFTARITPAEQEQIMRELAMKGLYYSVDLWRAGVEFDIGTTVLTEEQDAEYTRMTEVFREVADAWERWAPMNDLRGAASFGIRAFLQAEAKRRLFDYRVGPAIEEGKRALGRGEQVVFTLVSVSKTSKDTGNIPSVIRQINTRHIEVDDNGDAIDHGEIPEALRDQVRLLEAWGDIRELPDPIEALEDAFGKDNVTVITGKVSAGRRDRQIREFQSGQRRVAIISEAGTTGISLHHVLATGGAANGRRHLIAMDYPWSSVSFKQLLGRVDRSGQVSAPKITALSTGSAGEKKFLATIANRMQSLGALSKGSAESASNDKLTEFELGGVLDLEAMRDAYREAPRELQMALIGKVWRVYLGNDPDTNTPIYENARHDPPPDAQLKDFLLDLQFMPQKLGDALFERFWAARETLIAAEQGAEGETGRTQSVQADITRSTRLASDLVLHELRGEKVTATTRAQHRYGVIQGLITPRIRVITPFMPTRSLGSRDLPIRRYVTVTVGEGEQIAGLEVRINAVPAIKRAFGQYGTDVLDTPEKVRQALEAGDTVPLDVAQGWQLKRRPSDGLLAIVGAKMTDEALLTRAGAKFRAVGRVWHVPPDALAGFLERFPVKQRAPRAEGDAPTDLQARDEPGGVSDATPDLDARYRAARAAPVAIPGTDVPLLVLDPRVPADLQAEIVRAPYLGPLAESVWGTLEQLRLAFAHRDPRYATARLDGIGLAVEPLGFHAGEIEPSTGLIVLSLHAHADFVARTYGPRRGIERAELVARQIVRTIAHEIAHRVHVHAPGAADARFEDIVDDLLDSLGDTRRAMIGRLNGILSEEEYGYVRQLFDHATALRAALPATRARGGGDERAGADAQRRSAEPAGDPTGPAPGAEGRVRPEGDVRGRGAAVRGTPETGLPATPATPSSELGGGRPEPPGLALREAGGPPFTLRRAPSGRTFLPVDEAVELAADLEAQGLEVEVRPVGQSRVLRQVWARPAESPETVALTEPAAPLETSPVPPVPERLPVVAEPEPPAEPREASRSTDALRAVTPPIPTVTTAAGVAEPLDTGAVVRALAEAFGVPIRTGHFRTPKAIGIYKRAERVVRTKGYGQIAVVAHEVAHHVDRTTRGLFRGLTPAQRAELAALDYDPARGDLREGFAEYVRHYLTRDDAAAVAPDYHQRFTAWLPTSPWADAFDRAQAVIAQWRAQGARARVVAQIAPRARRLDPLWRALKDGPRAWWRRLVDDWYNRLAPLKREQESMAGTSRVIDTVPGDVAFWPFAKASNMAAGAKAKNAALFGMTDAAGNRVGPGLTDIIGPLAEELWDPATLEDFYAFVYARHALDVLARDKEPGITREDAEAVIAQFGGRPGWRAAADGLTAWHDGLLDYLMDAGGLDPALRTVFRDLYPHYIPLARYIEDEAGDPATAPAGAGGARFANLPAGVMRLKGSGRRILPPLETALTYAERIIGLADKIRVSRLLIQAAERYDRLGDVAERVSPDLVPKSFPVERVREQLEALGADLSAVDPGELVTVFENVWRPDPLANVAVIWRGGRREVWRFRPDLYRVLVALDKPHRLPRVLDVVLGAPARAIRLGATGLRAGFSLITNPLRDVMTAVMQTEAQRGDPLSVAFGTVRGVLADLTNDEIALLFKRGGGQMAQPLGIDRRFLAEAIDEILARTPKQRVLNWLHHPVDTLRELFSVPELGPRLAEFRAELERSGWREGQPVTFEQYVRAQFKAQNVTVDFREGGALGMWVNQVTPFFNANLQGPARMAYTIQRYPAQTLGKAVLWLLLPTLALWWAYKDEEWYVSLKPAERWRYWHLRVPTTGAIIRIPKPFEWGHVFSSVPEAIVDWAYRQDPTAVREALGRLLEDLTPPFIPGVAGPAIEVLANRHFYFDRPLVGKTLERLPPAERVAPYTTETAKAIGRLFGVPPIYVDHLVSGYTGGLGEDIVRAAERLTGTSTDAGRRPPELADTPVAGRLFLRPTHTRVFDDFYRYLEDLEQRAESAKRGGTAEPPDASDFARMRRVTRELAALRRDAREVVESTATDEAKRARLLEIHADMVGKALDAMREATYSGRALGK